MSKHAHNPTYKATEASKTAQYANPRKAKPTKRERRLGARIRDYNSIKETLGFHFPGSLQ